jgi:hypothetical protein
MPTTLFFQGVHASDCRKLLHRSRCSSPANSGHQRPLSEARETGVTFNRELPAGCAGVLFT